MTPTEFEVAARKACPYSSEKWQISWVGGAKWARSIPSTHDQLLKSIVKCASDICACFEINDYPEIEAKPFVERMERLISHYRAIERPASRKVTTDAD